MKNEVKSNLYPCAHCEESGTCRNGENGTSCHACIKKNELKSKVHVGLACGICGGIGQAEPMTERMNKRITPILSFLIIFPLFLLIWYSISFAEQHFTAILAFSGTLIGSVIGFYFSGKNN